LIAPTSSSALCKAPRDLVRLTIPLEAVKNAMSRDGDFRIVALGSSSTQGAGASSPKMCYPAQLEAELNRLTAAVDHWAHRPVIEPAPAQALAALERVAPQLRSSC
jgi:hypothetical protein